MENELEKALAEIKALQKSQADMKTRIELLLDVYRGKLDRAEFAKDYPLCVRLSAEIGMLENVKIYADEILG